MTPSLFGPHADNGYKLTYMGLDYLAMRVFVNRGTIAGVGRRIGVGKGALCGPSGWGLDIESAPIRGVNLSVGHHFHRAKMRVEYQAIYLPYLNK